jgi:hypothetical protein
VGLPLEILDEAVEFVDRAVTGGRDVEEHVGMLPIHPPSRSRTVSMTLRHFCS